MRISNNRQPKSMLLIVCNYQRQAKNYVGKILTYYFNLWRLLHFSTKKYRLRTFQ